MKLKHKLLGVFIFAHLVALNAATKPNIVIILADEAAKRLNTRQPRTIHH